MMRYTEFDSEYDYRAECVARGLVTVQCHDDLFAYDPKGDTDEFATGNVGVGNYYHDAPSAPIYYAVLFARSSDFDHYMSGTGDLPENKEMA
jgi:hypothetical protein